jgi:FkbM family methyltransferase
MKFVERLLGLSRRLRRARQFGFPYTRDKFWTLPGSIRIDGRMMPLSLPQDQGTRIACKDIFLDDVYGLRRLNTALRSVVDVGAHAGLFALCARILFPKAIIHAYEPNPEMQQFLERQKALGGFVVYSEAVGAKSDRASLVPGMDSVFAAVASDPAGKIPVVPISEVIDRIGGHIDLLKLDCEGGEWEILADIAAMRNVESITMEYHLSSARSLSKLENLVRSAGFRIHFQHADGETNGRIWARRER